MKRLNFDQDIRPLSEFRAKAASFVQHVHQTKRPLVITHRGQSAAVLIDVSEFEALMEKLELLQDINIAEKQFSKGEGVEHSKAKASIAKKFKK